MCIWTFRRISSWCAYTKYVRFPAGVHMHINWESSTNVHMHMFQESSKTLNVQLKQSWFVFWKVAKYCNELYKWSTKTYLPSGCAKTDLKMTTFRETKTVSTVKKSSILSWPSRGWRILFGTKLHVCNGPVWRIWHW